MNTFFSIAIACFFAAAAAYIIFFVGRAMFHAVSVDPRAWLEGLQVKKRESLAAGADEQLAFGQPAEALRILRTAFFFDYPIRHPQTIDRIHEHHMHILSRVLTIAQNHSRTIENLPVIEDLMATREQLLRSHIDHVEARRSLTLRRRKDKKETPAWAISEFTKKLDDITDKLATNRQSLEIQLDQAFGRLKDLAAADAVTVH